MKVKHKVRRKPNYEILIISDKSSTAVKKYNLTYVGRVVGGWLLALAIVGLAVYIGYMNYHTLRYRQNEGDYIARIDELTEENVRLHQTVDTQENTIHILSNTVNTKAEAEAEYTAVVEEKKLPNAFPFSGEVYLPEYKDEVLMPDGLQGKQETRPLFEFSVDDGTIVIAAGDGVVTEVNKDVTYGYEVVINHGNGYETIYRASAEPGVSVGDEVPQGGTVYILLSKDNGNDMKLGYQVRLDGEYVDPGTVLHIEG